MRKKKPTCVLCGAKLLSTINAGVLAHAPSEVCSVRVTDTDGLSIDEAYEIEDGVLYELLVEDASFISPLSTDPQLIAATGVLAKSLQGDFAVSFEDFNPYVSAEFALAAIFDEAGVPRLGGASGARGWSSISTFQKCPYLWKRRYLDSRRGLLDKSPKPPALEIGTLVHTFVAIGLSGKIDVNYPLIQTRVRDELLARLVNPEHVAEAWRVTSGYWAYYQRDEWQPLAVEHLLVDPKTKQSCRIDSIMWLEKPIPGCAAGTWLFDLKTAARFDQATKEGWFNDGEIIGLFDLYERTKAHKRFGPLQGIVVDIAGKQKDLLFHRTYVHPSRALVKDHRKSLQVWSAAIDTATAIGSFPRARAACVGRYGYLCDEFEHCTQRS